MLSKTEEIQVTAESTGNDTNVVAIHQNKILVPLRSEECCQRLFEWLNANKHLSESQLMLLHVSEPVWFTQIPYSGMQALDMIEEHHAQVLAKQNMLQRTALELHNRYPELKVSWLVRTHSSPVDAVAKLAREWNADCITVFTKPRTKFSFFNGNRLSRQIMERADRTVQVIQEGLTSSLSLLKTFGPQLVDTPMKD